jgi:ATP-binding cassette, subfamily B, bacterial
MTLTHHPRTRLIERRALRMTNYRPRQFWWGTSGWLLFFAYPILPGWLLSSAYNELKNHNASTHFFLTLLVLFVAEAVMICLLTIGHTTYMQAFEAAQSNVAANVLHAQLVSGGPEHGPRALSPGDAVARLRDDPRDLAMLVDNWADVLGAAVYGIAAFVILSSIDALAAFVAILPLIVVGVGNNRAGHRIRKIRSKARASTSSSTDFLAAAFGASLTVKVSGATRGVLHRIDTLNGARSRAMVSDQTWSDALWSINGTTSDICVGLALVVASRRVLSTGDISLFAAYAVQLIWLPQKIGGLIVGRKRFEVSAERLDSLLGGTVADRTTKADRATKVNDATDAEHPAVIGRQASVASEGSITKQELTTAKQEPATTTQLMDPLTYYRKLPILGGRPAAGNIRPSRNPLEQLELSGLTNLQRGVRDLSFTVKRRSLVVISGSVGAGKTSLLQMLLGLLPLDDGEVRWNGHRVLDHSAFFVPPQCAYVPQVPHLFSQSLLDNVLLGTHVDPTEAIRLAAFDDDVKGFSNGVATMVGAGGVRLSGGQAQRAAAARALIHNTELILFDDLTSALDVETEIALWDRLAGTESTVIAVSNRAVARSRADQIIEL